MPAPATIASTGNRSHAPMNTCTSATNPENPGRPIDASPPNSAIANAGLVAPEFQITNEPSVVAYVNYMAALIASGAGDFRANYADILNRADNSANLVEEVDILLGARLGDVTRASIRAAVDAIPLTGNGPTNRVYTAILLTLCSPEYLVQK